jgi:hypothetical protein
MELFCYSISDIPYQGIRYSLHSLLGFRFATYLTTIYLLQRTEKFLVVVPSLLELPYSSSVGLPVLRTQFSEDFPIPSGKISVH